MGIFDPQGLSSSPSSQSVVNSGIASWAQPYVMNYLNQGNALLNQAPTAFQQQVWDQAAGMQTPGQFAQGSNLLNQAGQGQLGTVNQALGYGAQGAGYGQQATQAGANYQNMATNPAAVGAYMNPYIQQSLAPQLALLNQQQALAGQGINARAVGQGAFGGNRATLAQGLNAQNYDLARQQAIGQGYNEAFRQAQQAQQFGANLGLQGLATGIQGANTGLQGVQGAQQGYTGATQAGVGLGNIGAQQSQADVARMSLQSQLANQQYNLPFQRLNFMQGLMSGLPVTSSTTTGYTAGQNPYLQGIGAAGTLANYAPSIWNTGKDVWNFVKGIGGDGYGAGTAYSNMTSDEIANMMEHGLAKGGEVKRYAVGGITSLNRKVENKPLAFSPDSLENSAQNKSLDGVVKLLAVNQIANAKDNLQAQQALQQPAKPPVLAQLEQRAGMVQQVPQGIDTARSNLPTQLAGGGIIAFEEGGDVPRFNTGGINWFGRADKGTEESTPSAFQEDIRKLNENTKEKLQIPDWLQSIGNYFTKPRQAPTDADAQPGGFYGNGSNVAPTTPAKPDSGIVIHPNAPKQVPTSNLTQITGGPAYKPADTSGIDALVNKYESMIRGGEDFNAAEAKAQENARKDLFLRLMNPERGASLVSGFGIAGLESQKGLEKAQEANQVRKDKQIGQLVALGLKGQDLKNEAKKLGISETELQAKLPLYQSEVTKNLATADYMRSGKGRTAGKIASATAYKIMEKYDGYRDPKTAPAHILNQLDPQTRKALTLPGTESYNRAMIQYNKLLQQEMANEIGMLQAIGGGSTSSLID